MAGIFVKIRLFKNCAHYFWSFNCILCTDINTFKTNDENLFYERSLLCWIQTKVIPVFILILRNTEFRKYLCTIIDLIYGKKLRNLIWFIKHHSHKFWTIFFLKFDKDNFTWYNFLSILLNLNKEVNSSIATGLSKTNHETISLHSNQLK